MGGYAAFVWPSYGLSLLGIGAAVVMTLGAYRRTRAALAVLEGLKDGTK
ncbi:MAG: heme exporter protein CcmD [Pseudomonadota bacterium]|nr:heme exporter protein CcmD [Pseudomonadota bacterium]